MHFPWRNDLAHYLCCTMEFTLAVYLSTPLCRTCLHHVGMVTVKWKRIHEGKHRLLQNYSHPEYCFHFSPCKIDFWHNFSIRGGTASLLLLAFFIRFILYSFGFILLTRQQFATVSPVMLALVMNLISPKVPDLAGRMVINFVDWLVTSSQP